MPIQLEIDFSTGEEPRKLIRAHVQDLVSTSLDVNASGISLPGKVGVLDSEASSKTIDGKHKSYKISSLF